MTIHNSQYRFLLILLVLIAPAIVQAQNNTNSPYSKFGIGDLANTSYGRNTALGGTGIGIRDPYFLNLKNPASLTAIDTLSFLFETGVSGGATWASTTGDNQLYWNGNLTHIAFGHRITPWLMGRATLMPYTNIGYDIRTTKGMEGEEGIVWTDWAGNGGLNALSYSLGIKPMKYLSLGVDASYVNGPINETRITASSAFPTSRTFYYSDLHYNGFMLNTGMQVYMPLDKKGSNLVIGGTFKPKAKLYGKGTVEIKQQYPSESASTYIDSVYTADLRPGNISTPMSYGLGTSLMLKGKYMLAADYEFNNWASLGESSYVDQNIYSFGLEKLSQSSLKFRNRCAYRVGFRYDSGYVTVKKNVIDDMRVTVGMGFPIKKSRSFLNVAIEAGERGTLSSGLVHERYTKMTVSMSLHDYWFVKRKFN